MNTREKFSAVLLGLGLMLVILPSGNIRLSVPPRELANELAGSNAYVTADQVARFIVTEDTIRLIDLRPPEEFSSFSLPGSVNVPYAEFLKNDPAKVLGTGNIRNILYSNGDIDANSALVIAKGLRFNNVWVMKGGMNEWFNSVMNSTFTGERISARENALFETRTRAKRLFTEMNNLPDSIRQKLLASKKLASRKLDGGCE